VDVSIHAPVKGATGSCVRFRSQHKGFNPRAREGRDRQPFVDALGHVVSIHAPVKGATGQRVEQRAGRDVSIHAPVKGATSSRGSPTSPSTVSIHAPVKGATPTEVAYEEWGAFQSTRP